MDVREEDEAGDRRDLAQIGAGDRGALARLYQRHADRVFGLALRLLRRRDVAEDAVQDAFLAVHKNAAAFRGESRVSTWICSIALNACRMRLRSERRGALSLDAAAEMAAPVEATGAGEEPGGRAAMLAAALATLDAAARELLLLSAQGRSYDEIGALAGLSADQVRGRLYRARKQLLDELKARGGGDV